MRGQYPEVSRVGNEAHHQVSMVPEWHMGRNLIQVTEAALLQIEVCNNRCLEVISAGRLLPGRHQQSCNLAESSSHEETAAPKKEQVQEARERERRP